MRASSDEIERLIGELNCDQTLRCQAARRALVVIGQAAVPYLVEALASKKPWIRWEAAKALSQIADPSATEALVDALENREFDLRWIAAEGLAAIGIPAVPSLLRVLLQRPTSIWLREGVHHVLSDMDRGELDDVLLPVIKALDGFDPSLEAPIAAKAALDEIDRRRREESRRLSEELR